jgi:hypothetical protein
MTGGQPDELWKPQYRQKSYINKITPPPYSMTYFSYSSNYKRLVSVTYVCPFFRKSFKMMIMLKMPCVQTT